MGTGIAIVVLIVAAVAFLLILLRAWVLDSRASGPIRAVLVRPESDESIGRAQTAVRKASVDRLAGYLYVPAPPKTVRRARSTRRTA